MAQKEDKIWKWNGGRTNERNCRVSTFTGLGFVFYIRYPVQKYKITRVHPLFLIAFDAV